MNYLKTLGIYSLIGVIGAIGIATTSVAGTLPLSFTSLPTIQNMVVFGTQVITYTISNNTPTTLPLTISGISTPVTMSIVPGENDCGSMLGPKQSCNIKLSIRPTTTDSINQKLTISYGGRFSLTSPIALTISQTHREFGAKQFSSFTGVDYAPAHYPQGDPRNDEDQANVIPELRQLQAAGFNVVRMYGEPAKTWIAVINAAYNQGMKVIYQLATCQSNLQGQCIQVGDSFSAILAGEITKLQNVINQVGTSVFTSVVPLVLIGNEVYFTQGNQSNINDLLSAASQTLAITQPLSIPTSISLQADVWISSSAKIKADLTSLVAALSPNAPIGINVYPFQWVVPVANSVNTSTPHSINWYMSGLSYPGNPVMIAETGWATSGNYNNPPNVTTGNLTSSETYFPLLYAYTKNTYPLLAFMAFDTPTKTTDPNFTSENFYGVFTDECAIKGGTASLSLLPNTSYNGLPQCSNNNAIFTFAGGSNTAQPPFSIQYTHGGFTYLLQVPTADRTQQSVTPWPTITLSPGDVVTLVSQSSTCTNTVASISGHAGGSWTAPGTGGTGSGQCNAVNWPNSSQTIFMPANF